MSVPLRGTSAAARTTGSCRRSNKPDDRGALARADGARDQGRTVCRRAFFAASAIDLKKFCAPKNRKGLMYSPSASSGARIAWGDKRKSLAPKKVVRPKPAANWV